MPSPMFAATIRFAAILSLFNPATETFAALDIRAKEDGTGIFRTETLEPPPMAILAEGESVTLLHRGLSQSLVETAGGVKGWVRNADLIAVESSGKRFALGDQDITSGEYNHGEYVLDEMEPVLEPMALERSFAAEVVEPLDREQVEMRHDEN